MAVKSFTIEGLTLAYFSGEDQTRHVLVEPPADSETPDMPAERLESFIARQLDFPNEAEFEAVYKRLDELRQRGLRPAEGEPDITRQDTKLRITVEVL